jgi:hypothetical protein
MDFSGVVDYSTPKLNTFWHYARVELTPPSPTDIPKITEGLSSLVKSAKMGKWKQVPVKVFNQVIVFKKELSHFLLCLFLAYRKLG